MLGSPAELRNRIYEYALYTDLCRLTKQNGVPEPPLLWACKQVRNEAIGIFYYINVLQVDAGTARLFERKRPVLLTIYDVRIHEIAIVTERSIPKNGRNLMRFLQCYHAAKCPTRSDFLETSHTLDAERTAPHVPFQRFLFGMGRVVYAMKTTPWDTVEVILALLRRGLAESGSMGTMWASD